MTSLRGLSIYCLAAALVFATTAMLCMPDAVSAWRSSAMQSLGAALNLPAEPEAFARIAIAPPGKIIIRRDAAVAARLSQILTPELLASFDLFLYVSKAGFGPVAQRMYVFEKKNGALSLVHDWPASTGREKHEVTPAGRRRFTHTPAGYYEIDPHRMYASYRSRTWDRAMPYTMFFNWVRKGYRTGLAIHAATGADIARLGQRASAGCIHLSPEDARTLFSLIEENYRGPMPRFAFDRQTGTMSNQGALVRDSHGRVEMTDGYKVLIAIDDFSGRDALAALF